MKVGILTFHAQINYGGMLQCVALQEVLRNMGHDVSVIDRWMGPHRAELDGVFASGLGLGRIREIVSSLCWWRGLLRQIRHWRSRVFFKRVIHCTPYHFYDWKDAPKDLGLDVVVCGSDQIWHCGDFGDPRPYLLEGASLVKSDGCPIHAIAYAASFGIPSIPNDLLPIFQKGFRRFAAISVRETRGVDLVEQAGGQAVAVLDPTLLVGRDYWLTLVPDEVAKRSRERSKKINRVVCYFISQDIEDAYPALEALACRTHSRIDVISTQLRPHVNTPQKMKNYFRSLFGRYPHVHLRLATGPQEFLALFAEADACITDSFHALMFSVNFNVNCRILAPQVPERRIQFSRFESFARYVDGPFIVSDVADAVQSIETSRTSYKYEELDVERARCWSWLKNAVEGNLS